MTSDYLEKLKEAIEQATKTYKEGTKEHNEWIAKNKKYADLYMKLVLTYIASYDFKTGHFIISEDNYKKITDVIGGANKVYAYVSEKEKVANIRIHYDRKGINQGFELSGLPSFYSDESFKLSCVNEILKENGIGIREDLWDGGERGSDSYIVTFDASMLLEQRDKLLKENNTGIKSR